MRTTLVIPDIVCKRAKALARRRHTTVSKLMTEALAARLSQDEILVREAPPPYQVKPLHMGAASVDVANRDELFHCMEFDLKA